MASGIRQLYLRLGMDASGLRKGVGSANSALGTLTKTAAIAGGAILALATKGVMAAAKYEQMRMTFETLTGSVSKGRKILEQFNEFAIKTPFETEDVNQAGLTLLNFGLETEKLLPTLQRLGDLSKGNAQDFTTLARVYGQARVEGKLMSKDIREFVSANIPIVKLLAEQLGVAEDQIFNMASEGKISFAVLEEAFKKATGEGGLFHGMMEKQSKSAIGLWSTFKDKLNIALRELGNMLLPAIKVGLENMTRIMDNVLGQMQKAAGETDWPYILAAGVQTVFDKLGDFFTRIYRGLGLLRALYHSSVAIAKAWEGVAAAFGGDFAKSKDLFSASGEQFGKAGQGIKDYGRLMGEILGFETSRSFKDTFEDNMKQFTLQSAVDKMSQAYDDALSAVGDLSLSSGTTGGGGGKPKPGPWNAAAERARRMPQLSGLGLFNTQPLTPQLPDRLAGKTADVNPLQQFGFLPPNAPDLWQRLGGKIAEVNPLLMRTGDEAERLVGFANNLGSTFVSAFDQIIQGGFKFGKFMKQLFMDIIKQAIKAFVITMALKAIGSAGSIGDIFKTAFGGGDLTGFLLKKTASGGITTRPQRRIVGEAGPEAIIPLNRGSSKNMFGGGGTNKIVGIIRGRDMHLLSVMGQQDAMRRGSPIIQF